MHVKKIKIEIIKYVGISKYSNNEQISFKIYIYI